jgi:hypothetical protein
MKLNILMRIDTTVTVEAINVSKDGIHKVMDTEEMGVTALRNVDKEPGTDGAGNEDDKARKGKRRWTKENLTDESKKKSSGTRAKQREKSRGIKKDQETSRKLGQERVGVSVI